MQIPIVSSLYYTTVVIRRPEFWASNFIAIFLTYKQCFINIIKNDTNHKNYDKTMSQSYSTYFNSIGKKMQTLPRCGLVTKHNLIVRHILCSINFWFGFVYQGVFFLTNAVLQSCRFYTGSIVPKL